MQSTGLKLVIYKTRTLTHRGLRFYYQNFAFSLPYHQNIAFMSKHSIYVKVLFHNHLLMGRCILFLCTNYYFSNGSLSLSLSLYIYIYIYINKNSYVHFCLIYLNVHRWSTHFQCLWCIINFVKCIYIYIYIYIYIIYNLIYFINKIVIGL